MASPVRAPPGAMAPDEAYVRLRRPTARAVAPHAGDGSPPHWHIAEHPTHGTVVLGGGPTEADAWTDAAARVRAWITFLS